jgi:hypothetical protein
MKCKKVRKNFQEYLEGTLESARKKKLEDHIKGCSSCKKELESLKTYFNSMGSIEPIRAPDGFLRSVRQRIEEAKKPARIIPIRIKVPLELAGAVAAIVIAVIVFRNIIPEKRELRPQLAKEKIEEIETPGEISTQEKVRDIESMVEEKAAAPDEIATPKELKSQRDMEAPQELPYPQEAAKEIHKEDLVTSLNEIAGDGELEISTPLEMESHERIPSQKESKSQRDLKAPEEFSSPSE